MISKKFVPLTFIVVLSIVLIAIGCDDSNYDQRTVVIVASVNDGIPYFSDVLNQGDSIYEDDGVTPKRDDDYVSEDNVLVIVHNRPYNNIINPCISSLGDFLITDYYVEYTVTFSTVPGVTTPVAPFSGKLNSLVPAEEMIGISVPIVPFYAKTISPLFDMHYTAEEIMTYATITFEGHEVQTSRKVTFTSGITVHFADPLVTDDK